MRSGLGEGMRYAQRSWRSPIPRAKGMRSVLDEKARAKLAEMQLKAYGVVILNLGDKVLREFQQQKTDAEILERIIEVEAEDSVDLAAMEAVVTDVVKAQMDELMTGHRGWRELAIIGDRLTSHDVLEEGAIWFPIRDPDNWTEEGSHSDFKLGVSSETLPHGVLSLQGS